MLVIKIIRGFVKLVAPAAALYCFVGWGGQFSVMRPYPWISAVWTSLKPIGRAVATQLPVVHKGVDFSLFVVIIAIAIAYYAVLALLRRLEDALTAFDQKRRWLKGQKKLEARPPPRPIPATSSTPAQPLKLAGETAKTPPPAAPAPYDDVPHTVMKSGTRIYQSELLIVLDLVDSTTIVTRFGNALLARLKGRLERHVLPICERHGVSYIKGTGDGYLVSFASLTRGMTALREVFDQLGAMNERLPDGVELALRASVNFGEVIIEPDGDRTGGAVHKTFRMQSIGAGQLIEAKGGIKRGAFPLKNYVIASEEALSGLQQSGGGIGWRLMGMCELKGFPGLHRIYEVEWLAGEHLLQGSVQVSPA